MACLIAEYDVLRETKENTVTTAYLRTNERPLAVFFSLFSASGRARFRIFSRSAVRARMRECRYAWHARYT